MTTWDQVWCAAVEQTWIELGTAGLTVRILSDHADEVAAARQVELPSWQTVIYNMRDSDGDKVFGDLPALIEVTQYRAKDDLLMLVQACTDSSEVWYPGAMQYCQVLANRPALRQMMATLTGPTGRDTDLDDLAATMTRWLSPRGGKATLAMLHGIAEAMTHNTLPKTHYADAVKRAVQER